MATAPSAAARITRAPSPSGSVRGPKSIPTDGSRKDYNATLAAIEAMAPKFPPPTNVGTSAEGKAFLEANQSKEGVVTLPCGLQYRVLKTGTTDKSPKAASECDVHYRGKLMDGYEFDSSLKRGKPARFAPTQVIQGWTVALQLMGVGDKWVLYVPSELAYGDAGRADERRGQYIPSGAVLIFEIELLKCHGPTKLKPRRPIEACAADVKPAAHAVADVPSGGAPLPTCPEVPSPTASATPSLASNGSAPGAQSTDADAERLPAAGPMSVFSRILEGNQASADELSPASAVGGAAAADAVASAAAGGTFSIESATELAGDSATESSGLFERDTYCRPTSANSTGGAASNGSSAVGSSTPKSSAKAAGEGCTVHMYMTACTRCGPGACAGTLCSATHCSGGSSDSI